MDTLTKEERSERMSRIRSKGSKAEMAIRKLVHGMGFRFRLHSSDLPGKPDLVFKSKKKIIFVHGCFWHRHENCKLARLPKSRGEFWTNKLEANKQRDMTNQKKLNDLGWKFLIIWECELADFDKLENRIKNFLT